MERLNQIYKQETELNEQFRHRLENQEPSQLKNIQEVKELEEVFNKGMLNAKIIKGKEGEGSSKGLNMIAKLAILGNQKKDGEITKDRNQNALMIRSGTPVSDISGRDLPSPAEIRGDTNVLLLPFYQEVTVRPDLYVTQKKKLLQYKTQKNLCKYIDQEQESLDRSHVQGKRQPHTRNASMFVTGGGGGSERKDASSRSPHLMRCLLNQTVPINQMEEPTSVTQTIESTRTDNKIMRMEIEIRGTKKSNPNSRYFQKLRARLQNENRVQELYREKKERLLKREQEQLARESDREVEVKKYEVDMKEIIRRAEIMRLGKPKDQVYIQHLSPLRVNKVRREL